MNGFNMYVNDDASCVRSTHIAVWCVVDADDFIAISHHFDDVFVKTVLALLNPAS